jgi:periplasmic protein TonB
MVRPGRLSGSLPLSIAVHVVGLVLVLLIPLVADDQLPPLPARPQTYIAAVAIPAPTERPLRQVTEAARSPELNSDAAPTMAPSRINPEVLSSGLPVPDLPVGDAAVSTSDVGALVDGAARVTPLPPPSPKPSGPIKVSELVQPPKKIVDVRPIYPDLARQARVEGTVVLEAILDRNGRVDQVRVVRSVPLLDSAALDAVHQWRYTPTALNGQPVAVLMTITIRFTLQ